jgi:hypothetical protein
VLLPGRCCGLRRAVTEAKIKDEKVMDLPAGPLEVLDAIQKGVHV